MGRRKREGGNRGITRTPAEMGGAKRREMEGGEKQRGG